MLRFPGDFLAFEAEKVSGLYTYERDGKIFAAIMGFISLDSEEKTISIKPVKEAPPVPTLNSIVLAKVVSLNARFVWCEIVAVNGRAMSGPFRGLLRKEDIRATQKDQADPAMCFRPGDLIRARVINLLGRGLMHSGGDHNSSEIKNANDAFILSVSKALAGSVKANSTVDSRTSNATCLLSTAESDLGVVLGIGRDPAGVQNISLFGATSGSPLIPCAWTEMVCPDTLRRFPKKVARVPGEYISSLFSSENNNKT